MKKIISIIAVLSILAASMPIFAEKTASTENTDTTAEQTILAESEDDEDIIKELANSYENTTGVPLTVEELEKEKNKKGDISLMSTDDLQYGDVYYRISDDYMSVIITGLSTTAKTINVPSKINGLPVVGLYGMGSYSVTSMNIPSSVKTIGAKAFYYCQNLTSISLSEGLEVIGEKAFEMTKIQNLIIPKSVQQIYPQALSISSLKSLTIPFVGISRTSGTTLGYMFSKRYNTHEPGYTRQSTKALHADYTYAYLIPENLSSVTVTDATSIPDGAFCAIETLTNIKINEGVNEIGNCAFAYCRGLYSISIPNDVTTIGDYCFYGCTGTYNFYLPSKLENIGNAAFYQCTRMSSFSMPSSVKTVGANAFGNCTALRSVYTSDFAAWLNIDFGNKTSNPTYYTKSLNCYPYISYNSINIPKSVTEVKPYTLYNLSGIKTINIPDSVAKIGTYAMAECTSLTSLSIPSSVTDIGEFAFGGCTSIKNVNIESADSWCNITFANQTANPLCYGNAVLCTNDNPLSDIEILDTTNTIKVYTFNNEKKVQRIYIPKTVKTIENNAFLNFNAVVLLYEGSESEWNSISISETGNQALNSINKVYNVNSIDETILVDSGECNSNVSWQMYNDGTLKITGNGNMTEWSGATNTPWYKYSSQFITNIVIDNGINNITDNSYTNCQRLSQVTIPESVSHIGSSSFYNCPLLKDIYYNEKRVRWQNVAQGVDIPSNVIIHTVEQASDFVISEIPSKVYNGNAITPDFEVKFNNVTLEKDVDYTIEYSDNTEVGIATITITGTGVENDTTHSTYNGAMTVNFRIAMKDIADCTIESISDEIFTSTDIQPDFIIHDGNQILVEGTDYEVQFGNNINAGTAYVKVIGLGTYGNSTETSFKIIPKNIVPSIEMIKKVTYTGSPLTPAITLKDNDKILIKDTDYTITYNNNINAGVATVTAVCKGNYSGETTAQFTIEPKSIKEVNITPFESFIYTGEAVTPVAEIFDEKTKLSENIDYTVEYSDNVNVGTAHISVIGTGNYTDDKTFDFIIEKADSDTNVTQSTDTVTYGSILTLSAEVHKSELPMQNLMSYGLLSFNAMQDKVDFYVGEGENKKLIGSADVVYSDSKNDSGTAVLEYDTSDKKLSVGENIITAEYGGSVNINGGANVITTTLVPKEIGLVWSNYDTRPYDDNASNIIAYATGVIGSDEIGVSINDGDKVNAGIHTATAKSLTGNFSEYYTLPSVNTKNYEITKIDGTATVTMSDYKCLETDTNPIPVSKTNGNNATYQYKSIDAEDSAYSNVKPTKAGKYMVKATFDETENYNTVIAFDTFTVNHSFADTWSSDENYHWHATICGHDVKTDEEKHSWDDGIVTKSPAVGVKGEKTYTCTVCKKTRIEELDAINEYLITFIDYDNSVLQSSKFAMGMMPVYSGKTPAKPDDEIYSYKFIGWSPTLVTVSGVATYTAQFKQEIKSHTTPIPVNDSHIKLTETNTTWDFEVTIDEPEENSFVYAAVYDEKGQLVGIGREPLDAVRTTTVSVKKIASGKLGKVFIWDEDMKPVKEEVWQVNIDNTASSDLSAGENLKHISRKTVF